MAAIAAISLLVSAIWILTIMLIAVGERTAEIGLLKAVGASAGQIQLLFLAKSVGLSLVGGAGGAIGLWMAGRSARGIGLWIGLLLLAATAIDLLVGIANAPWWYEFVTALVMVPTAMLAGGARLQTLRSWGGRRRHRPAAAR